MNRLLKMLPFYFCLLFLDCAGQTLAAMAADAPKTTLVMFIAQADVPPYYLEASATRDKGILVDMLRAVAEPLQLDFIVRQLPDKRGWDMLEHGGVDVYASAREWVENPDKFLWTDPFMNNEDVLLCRAGSRLVYNGPESLHGLRIAGIKGFVYPALEPHFASGEITRLEATSPQAMLELLLRGRADAVLVNRTEILWMFRNHKDLEPHRYRLDPTPVGSACYRFVFPKGRSWEPVVEEFNHRLEVMKRDGTLKAILDRYR